MAAPTFVAEYETAWNSGTPNPRTGSVTTALSDVLAVVTGAESNVTFTSPPTGGTGTYTLRQTVAVANFCALRAWTVSSGVTAQTYTLSITNDSGTSWNGWGVHRFSGSGGIGATAVANPGTTGAPTLAITTTGANSAIVVFCLDWNANDGASRTWRTVNSLTPTAGNGFERTYFRDASHYTVYGAYYPDAGTAGAKTVGLSAPGSQKYSIVAVEILGAGGATHNADGTLGCTATLTTVATGTKPAAADLAPTATLGPTGVGTKPASTTLAVTATFTAAATPTRAADASLAATATFTPTGNRAALPDATLPATATLTPGATVSGAGADTTLTVTATLAPVAARTALAGTTLATTVTLAPATTTAKPADAALPILAALSADAARVAVAVAQLATTATLQPDTVKAVPTAATVAGTAALTPAGAVGTVIVATATATLTTTAAAAQAAAAVLALTATILAGGGRSIAAMSSVAASVAIVATAAISGPVSRGEMHYTPRSTPDAVSTPRTGPDAHHTVRTAATMRGRAS